MKKWKKFVFGLLFGTMICFLLPKPVLQTDAAAPFDVNEFIDIASANINAMRMENGLEPLQTAPLLQKMCQERADELIQLFGEVHPDLLNHIDYAAIGRELETSENYLFTDNGIFYYR